MFYLDRDVPLVHGHAIYIDSEWALTSISQRQFWPGSTSSSYGDGRVEGILSVDVSEWERARACAPARSPRSAPPRRSATRSGRQLSDHLNDDADAACSSTANVVSWFLDPAIQFPNPTEATNLEPLLVNTAGSWADRPGGDHADRQPLPRLATSSARTPTSPPWRERTRRRVAR